MHKLVMFFLFSLPAAALGGTREELVPSLYRDTNGCVKLRPACLELLNEFISGQEK